MVVAAQEGGQALRRVPHVLVRLARLIVALIVLARTFEFLKSSKIAPRDGLERGSVTSPAAIDGGPAYGALISATLRNTSGRISAQFAATGEPKS